MGVRGSPGGILCFWWIRIGFDVGNRVRVISAPPGGSGPRYRPLSASLPSGGREAMDVRKRIIERGKLR
jgi:hypothetical protein